MHVQSYIIVFNHFTFSAHFWWTKSYQHIHIVLVCTCNWWSRVR